MFKKFGIYTNEEYLRIIVKFRNHYIIGLEFPSCQFKVTSNELINIWLKQNYKKINNNQLFYINLKDKPNTLIDYGYLGQVNDEIQNELKTLVDILDVPF